MSAAVFTDAIDVFQRYDDQSLSLTDATSVTLVERHDLDGILSFDDDFDGLIQRFDPETVWVFRPLVARSTAHSRAYDYMMSSR